MKRTHSRLRWLLISVPFAFVALAFAFKLIGLSATTGTAITMYNTGAYEASQDASSTLLEGDLLGGNFIEPWIPWFNRGDAKAANLDFTPAIDDFEHALELAPADKECTVRVNLSLSWELLGDSYASSGYPQGAEQLYDAAEKVITDAGDKCEPPDPAAEELSEAGDRIEQKKEAAQQATEEQEAADPTPTEQEDKLEELDEQGQQSDQEKANGDARDRGEDEGQSGFTEKPW